jgi:phosphoglycolate phosphatase
MPQPATVLFDFDLTLADSSAAVVECVQHALTTAGFPRPEPQRIVGLIGYSLSHTFAELAPGCDPEPLIRSFLERADVTMVDSTSVFPEVPGVVATLLEREYRLGVVSTKFRKRIQAILANAGVADAFDVIVGGDDVEHAKPDPEGLHLALSSLGCDDPRQAVYVGDSVVDGAAAHAAGVPFVGVLSGATDHDSLLSAGAEHVLTHLHELPSLLDSWLVAGAPSKRLAAAPPVTGQP